jgi:predicted enzyme related to lactoylglutathione lyase
MLAVVPSPRQHVTGVGGVFFRAKDPSALSEWYRDQLGVPMTDDGFVVFPESRNTVWAPFAQDSEYWPREKELMVNFTVTDLDAMLEQLRTAGVWVDEKIEEMEFGRFGWARDPEGNRIELWEPSG